MITTRPWLSLAVAAMLVMWLASAAQAEISRFVGTYAGSADVILSDGSTRSRNLNVEISKTREGFEVAWSTVTRRADGTDNEKSYRIEFLPSDRENVFAAAMKRNVFGHSVQLDPMKGEPYVWSRIVDDTLTVFSLFVAADGGYEIQRFDRTLTEGGLDLAYESVRNGRVLRTVEAFLKRQ